MQDKQHTSGAFRRTADRTYHELNVIMRDLPKEARQLLASEQEKALQERERTEQRQREGRESEVQQEQKRLEKEDAPENVLPPPSYANAPQTKSPMKNMASARTRAERLVDERHKAERDAIGNRYQQKLESILAVHALQKVRVLDTDRQHTEALAAQKRADRDATRTDKDQRKDPSPGKSEDEQTRQKEFIKRVAARIRKSKERDERSRPHDHEHE